MNADLESSRPQLNALTSVRFFAALFVLIFHLHTLGISGGPFWYRTLVDVGYIGVGLFFVLSGFILVYRYAGHKIHFTDFWRARFARIYPAYIFSLAITAPGIFYTVVKFDVPQLAWIKEHLLLSAILTPLLLQAWLPDAALAWNSVAWSLSVEAFFYLLFPFILKVLARMSQGGLFVAILACWAVSLSLSSAYVMLNPDGIQTITNESLGLWLNALRFNPLARLPEFVLGCCAGLLFLYRAVDRRWGTPLILAGLLAFGVTVMFSPHIPHVVLHTGLLAPAFAVIIYGLALRPGWTWVLERQPLVLLGNASYSLYLLHVFVIIVYFQPLQVIRWGYQSMSEILVFMTVVIGLSVLVYRFIEEPARRWLRPSRRPL